MDRLWQTIGLILQLICDFMNYYPTTVQDVCSRNTDIIENRRLGFRNSSCTLLVHNNNELCMNGYANINGSFVSSIDSESYIYRAERRIGGVGPMAPIEPAMGIYVNYVSSFIPASFPEEAYHRPSVCNGHIGTVIHGRTMFINGLYNGYRDKRSHRAEIPSTVNINVTHTLPSRKLSRQYLIDGLNGLYIEKLTSDDLHIEQTIYAHRNISSLLVLEITVQMNGDAARTTGQNLTLYLSNTGWWNSRDVNFSREQSGMDGVSLQHGRIYTPETETSGRTPVFIYYDDVPDRLIVRHRHQKWIFLTSAHPLKSKALDNYKTGLRLLKQGLLKTQHIAAWHQLWSEGRIDISGNLSLARLITSSYFYILSSVPLQEDPDWPFCGLSPNGLPWGGVDDAYWGHYFWDQSTWMYPPVLLTHHVMAKLLIDTRARTVTSAAENARRLRLKGLKYAWESAFTGVETTPLNSSYASQELHVNGDVAFAVMQYYWLTGDAEMFLKESFDKVILGIADFWIGKMKFSQQLQMFTINGIQPPDEYATNVNNSVYTNVVAQMSLEAAARVAQLLGAAARSQMYANYARQIYIPFDEEAQYHPEYDGYKQGTVIKQADVVLLGFPLMYNMTEAIRRRDLEIYEKVTDEYGPAMTWTMHGIAWLELGEHQRAWSSIAKVYNHVVNGFQTWSENADGGGAPNFLTGMGGFLQSILFGYGGLRLKEDRLEINPVLPPGSSVTNFTGLDYKGMSLDLSVSDARMTLTPHSWTQNRAANLCFYQPGEKQIKLQPDIKIFAQLLKSFISTCR